MAITKKHLVFDLLNIVRGGQQANSELLSSRQVSFWIDNTRAKLIRQDLNKGRTLNPDLIQSLGCVAVSTVDASECGCVSTGCSVVRTNLQIPATVETSVKNLLTRVGPIHAGQSAYSMVPYHSIPYLFTNPFTKSTIKASLHNRYIYVLGVDIELLSHINIQGVFDRPEDVAQFTTCSGDSCFTDDSPYPISAWMIEDMKRMILEADFRIAAAAPTDKSADGSHNIAPPINAQTTSGA